MVYFFHNVNKLQHLRSMHKSCRQQR